MTKRVVIPVGGCSRVFPGGRSGRVLLLSGDELCLFDVDAASILGSAVVSGIKRCCWNAEGSRLAVVTKTGVMLLGESMKVLAEVTEKVRVKDALWEKSGVLLYNTMNQLKYLLPSGEGGIVRSLDEPVYLVAVSGRVVKAFTRKGDLISFAIDSTEFMLKVAALAWLDVALPGAAALPRSHPPHPHDAGGHELHSQLPAAQRLPGHRPLLRHGHGVALPSGAPLRQHRRSSRWRSSSRSPCRRRRS